MAGLYKHNERKNTNYSNKDINKISELQKENTNLKYENQKLNEEIGRLKDYISRTFQVVNLLFDFSTDSLKRIIDDFIKNIERW